MLTSSQPFFTRLALGTMTFGGQTDEAAARSMVDLCLERGVNFIDTANVYTSGQSESILGRLVKGRRDRVILATKVGMKVGEQPDDVGLSRAAIRKAIDASLQRLQTDYVDFYYLHQPDYSVPIEESLEALDELVQAGKVRQTAVSNYAAWQICRMLWLCDTNGWERPALVQPMYNLLARRIETELVPLCQEYGLGIAAYNPLAGGLLTGKHPPEAPLADSRFVRMPAYRDRYWQPENFAAVERLKNIAADAGRSLPRLAIGWLLAQSAVTSIIVGASRLSHLEENLAALDDPLLSADALAACDAVWPALRGVSPNYNR
jgi:aryl-alcohol dehydrogenase-like predicted oxidoreductase